MEQAKQFVCPSCFAGVGAGQKFCARCGGAVPPEVQTSQTLFYGELQNPLKAKLVVIRGEGMEGVYFILKSDQHAVGRTGQLAFDDPFISPKHTNFFYRDGRLFLRDEGSTNGTFLRVRGSVELASGDSFLVGDQHLRLVLASPPVAWADAAGTSYYCPPQPAFRFRVEQLLQGGAVGAVVHSREQALTVGREGCDLNFPLDPYMSPTHVRIEEVQGRLLVTDQGTRNGTYVRVRERELQDGDYVYLGRKLLRVELNKN